MKGVEVEKSEIPENVRERANTRFSMFITVRCERFRAYILTGL